MTLPDYKRCRTEHLFENLSECLVENGSSCSFSLPYGPSIFCLHHHSRRFAHGASRKDLLRRVLTLHFKGKGGEGALVPSHGEKGPLEE